MLIQMPPVILPLAALLMVKKKNHKKGRKKSRESSPTPYVVANPEARRLRKSSLLTALDAMRLTYRYTKNTIMAESA